MRTNFNRKYTLPTNSKVYLFLAILEINKMARYISHLLCLLHEMLLHYINMKLTNDITCRSFVYKGILVFSMITVIPLYICFALK